MPKMKSESWIVLELLIGLMGLGALSFFFIPVYEKGAWVVIDAVKASLALVLGYKFGKALPQQASQTPPVAPPIPPNPPSAPPDVKV
jgi:hypothetical protein